jgi:hypothetical protein
MALASLASHACIEVDSFTAIGSGVSEKGWRYGEVFGGIQRSDCLSSRRRQRSLDRPNRPRCIEYSFPLTCQPRGNAISQSSSSSETSSGSAR